MNSWNFTGNLGNDAEQRVTPNGDAVVSFSVGVKSGYGDRATTTWARCQMWGKRAESVAPFLKKGQLVGVVGEFTLREYDKNDGSKGYSADVRVNDLTLLGKRDGDQQQAPQQRQQAPQRQQPAPAGDFDDDIPFMRHAHGAAWRAI